MLFTNFILFILRKQKLFKSESEFKQQILNEIKQDIYKPKDLFELIYRLFKFDSLKRKINATNKNFSKCLNIRNKQITINNNDKIKHCSKFGKCLNLKHVILDTECVTAFMFKNCISLEKVYLKNTKYIHKQAFMNCISLKKIYIPKDIQVIDEDCFKNCLSLAKVIFY